MWPPLANLLCGHLLITSVIFDAQGPTESRFPEPAIVCGLERGECVVAAELAPIARHALRVLGHAQNLQHRTRREGGAAVDGDGATCTDELLSDLCPVEKREPASRTARHHAHIKHA